MCSKEGKIFNKNVKKKIKINPTFFFISLKNPCIKYRICTRSQVNKHVAHTQMTAPKLKKKIHINKFCTRLFLNTKSLINTKNLGVTIHFDFNSIPARYLNYVYSIKCFYHSLVFRPSIHIPTNIVLSDQLASFILILTAFLFIFTHKSIFIFINSS